MWIFTRNSFISVVAHRDEPDALLVRARARRDLEALPLALNIQHTPHADYAFRAEVSRSAFAAVVADLVGSLDYDNYKNAAHAARFPQVHALHEVWDTMRSAYDSNEPRFESERDEDIYRAVERLARVHGFGDVERRLRPAYWRFTQTRGARHMWCEMVKDRSPLDPEPERETFGACNRDRRRREKRSALAKTGKTSPGASR